MFCPNCGSNNTTEQKFCRSCGLNLKQTAISLLAQFPNAEYTDLQKKERMLEKFGNIAFTGFGVAIITAIGAIIYVILSKMVFSGTQPFAGILMVLFIFFAVLSLGYVVFSQALKEKREKLNPRLNSQKANFVPRKPLTDEAAF